MSDLCRLIWCALIGLFRPRAALEAEILVLRHQLNVLRRKSPKRVTLSSIDRLLLVGLYRLAPGVVDALKIIRPETLLRWHRAGFRAFCYGGVFTRRVRAMGIRDRPIAPRSPWQNGCAERPIGSIRRDCLDPVVVFGERHLRYLLKSYQKYYNGARTHLSLQKDAPIPRAVQTVGQTLAVPILGGLHHQYIRA